MKIKILKLKDWLNIVVLVILFPPGVIQAYASVYSVSLMIKCVLAAVLIFMVYAKKKNNIFITAVMAFYLIQVLATIVHNSGYTIVSIREALCSLAIVLGAHWIFCHKKEIWMRDLNILLTFYIIVNCFLTIIAPNFFNSYQGSRLIQNNYFLGIKNQVALVLIPITAYVMIYNFKEKQKRDVFTLIILFMAFISEYIIDSSTGFISMAVMIILYIFSGKHGEKLLNAKTLIIVFLVLNVILIFMQAILTIPSIQRFIVSILHRDVTLSNRTTIWAQAILRFKESPIMGLGRQENKSMILFAAINVWDTSSSYSAHNTLLQTLLESGFLGVIPLIVAIISLVKCDRRYASKITLVSCIGLAGIMVSFLAEAYDLTYFFALGCFIINHPFLQAYVEERSLK